MVKTVIYLSLVAISASSVLAEVPEAYRREASDNDLLARNSDDFLEGRDYPETMFSREDDIATLQEREPFFFLGPLIGMAARVGAKVAAKKVAQKVAKGVVKHKVKEQQNKRRKRELESEDELDLAARGDMDEFVERELDMIEREMNEDDILERELEEDLYLD